MPPRPIPAYDFGRSPSARPLGLSMCQNRWAVPTWSYAMERRPPARIVEVGTYSGGFACALALHASRIGARVVTYDRALPEEGLRGLAAHLGVEFRTGDVWELEGEIGGLVAQPGTSFLLCDGGDKPRELRTLARYLKPGDVVAVHDYACDDGTGFQNAWWGWEEIRKSDGDAVAAELGLRPWLQDHFDLAAWLCYERPAGDPRLQTTDLGREVELDDWRSFERDRLLRALGDLRSAAQPLPSIRIPQVVQLTGLPRSQVVDLVDGVVRAGLLRQDGDSLFLTDAGARWVDQGSDRGATPG